ncbi:hypothetical protein [Streptomyces endophyticus]|uniref:Bacterial Ig-like domain-containing protein n=1 Tax=Streptomyces endophyticus TaxID=714166 RepID=A0ABU6FG80_9ACTN|nr:hypothetical protein [Streptomyces endophyticus]MEB8343055.1 hypothetical protein [Streptomyces endophyticus]
MSKAAAPGRKVLSGIETSGGHPVEYRFAHAEKGNRHLVVVFANFAAHQDYGWSNGVFDKLRANILWIRDKFDGNRTYYLCKGMDFSVEQSVITLISNVMKSLDLTPDSVTMWGGSKGGSAALYFGLKYGFRNIVAITPQFAIGSYVRDVHPGVARFMLGEAVPEENVRMVDALIPELVASGAGRAANIYLMSAAQDEQYATQIEPYLRLFGSYENFNFVFSDSPHIADHTQVAGRNVPVLMGIANMLIDGIAPRMGVVRNGFEEPGRDRSRIDAYLASTSVMRGAEFPAPTVTAPAFQAEMPRQSVWFTGVAPGAVRVSIWEHGKFLGQTDVAPDGSWSWELGRPWSKGKHPVKVFSADANGFQSERVEVLFTAVDGAAALPAPEGAAPSGVLSPAAYEQVMGSQVVFTGVTAGAVQVGFREQGTPLGSAAVGHDGRWSWDSGWEWTPGAHVVDVVVLDAFGGETPISQVPFSVMGVTAGAASQGYYGGSY